MMANGGDRRKARFAIAFTFIWGGILTFFGLCLLLMAGQWVYIVIVSFALMIPGVILIIVGVRLYRKNKQKLRQEVEEQNRNQGAPVVVGYDPAATTPNVSSSAPQAYGGFTYNNEASTAPPPSYGEAAKF